MAATGTNTNTPTGAALLTDRLRFALSRLSNQQKILLLMSFAAVIALLGSYMICREEQEDTLKSLRLIPVDEVKLTLSKMMLALVFSVLIYLLLFAITFLVEAVLHFEVPS